MIYNCTYSFEPCKEDLDFLSPSHIFSWESCWSHMERFGSICDLIAQSFYQHLCNVMVYPCGSGVSGLSMWVVILHSFCLILLTCHMSQIIEVRIELSLLGTHPPPYCWNSLHRIRWPHVEGREAKVDELPSCRLSTEQREKHQMMKLMMKDLFSVEKHEPF